MRETLWQRLSGLFILLIWVVILYGIGWALHHEARTSRIQAELFSKYAQNLGYSVQPGRNRDLRYPGDGPYDRRFGYSRLSGFLDNLEGAGYEVESQPRLSQSLNEFIDLGGFAVYNEKTSAGMTLYDRAGGTMYSVRYPTRTFDSYDDIPPLIAQTLLFIENRNLLEVREPFRNPAVDWKRFLLAALGQFAKKINPAINLGGGSTLATQIEKFRHSPEGRTGQARDKLRQMFTASVRAYRQGPETLAERKRVVLDYLNSTPLTARSGLGEVNGIGDGLYAWYGTELADAKNALSHPAPDEAGYRRQALLYKQVLSLILAERRPSYYLITNRDALNVLANDYLKMLATAHVIDPSLAALAAALPLEFAKVDPTVTAPNWITLKAANAVRLNLMKLLGLSSLYELDRIDVSARSTLDTAAQNATINLLQSIATADGANQAGLVGFRLFRPTDDFTKVIYSAVLYEKTPFGNAVRVQADNLDKPLDLNEGAKLDLGSTAKLRTLASYLEFIGDIYDKYRGRDAAALAAAENAASDNLTRFVVGALRASPAITLEQLLDQAMERHYSANPGEVFFTGGGIHTFVNFEHWEDGGSPSVSDALANSVNLSFVRIMRDVVDYLIAQGPITRRQIFSDPDHPARQAYLARFADREGSVFLSRYYGDYHGLTPDAALQKLLGRAHKTLTAQAVIFRSVHPADGQDAFNAFMTARQKTGIQAGKKLSEPELANLYASYGMDKYSLADRGYIAGVNPLELWLVDYLAKNPKATREATLQASVEQRQQTYSWLFQTRFRGAQDTRIRILIEQDAFARLHDHWAKLGYPFDRLVPSLATAIGSSADRPGALADLMGIIVNDGVKLPTVRIEDMTFAAGTPYEAPVKLKADAASGSDAKVVGTQVMRPETAAHLRAALLGVVERGTAKRVAGIYHDEAGQPLPVGGKTGTGDHRFKVFSRGGGLVSSRAVARTATFVFYIGNRFYGTITAHVEGEQADNYQFTSALAAQLLKALAPAIEQLVAQQPGDPTLPKRLKAGPEPAGEDAGDEETEDAAKAPAAVTPSANLPSDEPLPAPDTLPAAVTVDTAPAAAQPAPLPAAPATDAPGAH